MSSGAIVYSGIVQVPTEDQGNCCSATPTLVSALNIVQHQDSALLNAANRKVSISGLCVETSLLVPHTVFIIKRVNGQPALTTPYNSLSRPIKDSDSPVIARVNSKKEDSLSKVSVCVDGSFPLQPGLTINDTIVSDVVIAIFYDVSCSQISSMCHQEPVCGAFSISFSVSDAAATAASAGKMAASAKSVASAASILSKAASVGKKNALKSDGEFDSAIASVKKSVSHLADGASSALKGMKLKASKVHATVGKRMQELRQKAAASLKAKGALAKKQKAQSKSSFVTI